MTKIEREKETVSQMVAIYCRHHHDAEKGLCDDCRELVSYAHARLDRCRFGEGKPTCRKCTVHCYRPAMRGKMRDVMRYAGPRMILHHPVSTLRHIMKELG